MLIFAERTKRVTLKGVDDESKNIEEDWPLKDVVFVEDQKSLPIGIFSYLRQIILFCKS